MRAEPDGPALAAAFCVQGTAHASAASARRVRQASRRSTWVTTMWAFVQG